LLLFVLSEKIHGEEAPPSCLSVMQSLQQFSNWNLRLVRWQDALNMQIAELRAHAKSSELRPRMDHVCMQGSSSQTCVHNSLVRIIMMMLPSRINPKQMNRDTVRFPIRALVTGGYGSGTRTSSTRDQTTACMLSETSNAQKRGERERSHEHRSDNDLHKTRLHKIPETFYS
jgi:hypothetical protein